MAWLKSKNHLNAIWQGVGLSLGATWLKSKSNLCYVCHGLDLGLEMPPSPSPKCHVTCEFQA
jgi:hypothetical protein